MLGLFRRREPLSGQQRLVLAERVWQPYRLGPDDTERHAEQSAELLHRFDWEAAKGFEVTAEMVTVVAGLAALLVLGVRDQDPYRHVSAVVLHPAGMQLHTPRRGPSTGVVVGGPQPVDGHTAARDPVHLSWRTIQREARRPASARNLVLHEFAHQLDMLDGTVDGTPPMPASEWDRWVEVCTHVYERLVEGGGSRSLRPYAATNPGEFFAVATESLFQRPVELRDDHPELYAVLVRYYGQDPGRRIEAADRDG